MFRRNGDRKLTVSSLRESVRSECRLPLTSVTLKRKEGGGKERKPGIVAARKVDVAPRHSVRPAALVGGEATSSGALDAYTAIASARGGTPATLVADALEKDKSRTGCEGRNQSSTAPAQMADGVSQEREKQHDRLAHSPPDGSAASPGADLRVPTLYSRKRKTKPRTIPSWIRAPPLPLCTERAKRVLVLESDVLKLSNAPLCGRKGRERGQLARSTVAG